MKKNVFEMVWNMVNGREVEDMETLRNEINAEHDKLTEKATAKASVYDAAKPVVLGAMGAEPMTAKEIFEKVAADLPTDFSVNKMLYAFRTEWADAVVKHENGKGANTYSRR